MPECRKCHRYGPSCDYRRTSLGHVCRDAWNCEHRVKLAKSIEKALAAANNTKKEKE